MRVVIADDSLLTRAGIAAVLTAADIEVVGNATNAGELRAIVLTEHPDVAIVDIRMPPTFTDEGLRAAAELRVTDPELGVLVLSHHIEPAYAARVVSDYPERTGYLLKDRLADGAVLIDALRRIQDGETVIDPTIVSRLLGRGRLTTQLDVLTVREREVLGLVAEGMSNHGIAQRLMIGERTVESHVARVFEKLALGDEPDSHRRVLAVLAYLRGTG